MPDLSYYVANQRMERGVSSTGTVLPGRKPLHRSVGTCVFFFEKGEEGMRRRRQVYKKVSYSLKLARCLISSAFRLHPNPLDTLNLRKTPHIMAATTIIFASLLAVAFTSPVAVPDPNPQLSIPPLLPPGVIPSGADPALPVLQLPTPPLPSPPFTGSDIKPKKIGYFWTGAGDNQHAGKLFTRPSICPFAKKFHSFARFPGNIQS